MDISFNKFRDIRTKIVRKGEREGEKKINETFADMA